MAQAAFEAGKLDAAVEVLRSSLEIYPESVNLHVFMGMAMMQSGDAAAASTSFEKALELDPESSRAKRGLMMLERQEQPEG